MNSKHFGRGGSPTILDLPRWIPALGITALVALAAACSSSGTGSATSDEPELRTRGRWIPTEQARAAGAQVRLPYEEAPAWSPSACGGKLRPGTAVLGEYLADRFPVLTSIGGYACRRNTANGGRVSVHGTGRALDLFVPRIDGDADNTAGDAVANWLVEHAQEVGVQLVIWDHSVWRSNGKNDAPYTGPNPHTDHLHVELIAKSAEQTERWFGGDDGDPGEPNADPVGPDLNAVGSLPDAAQEEPPQDAAVADAGLEPVANEDAAGAMDRNESPAPLETGDDEPGETNSLPSRPSRPARNDSRSPVEAEEASADGGCSAARGSFGLNGTSTAGLAIGLGLVAWRRRKRR